MEKHKALVKLVHSEQTKPDERAAARQPVAMETHEYKPLDLTKDAIRLVRLLQGSTMAPIQCELIDTFLHERGIPYEALSYTWDDPTPAKDIFLDGCTTRIGDNLFIALKCLRSPEEDRILWIDAICINQEDNREKSHQVGQMRHVYESASQVLIWLGANDGFSEDIGLLEEIAKQLDRRAMRGPNARASLEPWKDHWRNLVEERGGTETDFYQRRKTALQRLLGKPWFRRVWIVQEVASARTATVVCGSCTLPSRAFAVLPSLMGLTTDAHTQAILEVMPGPLRLSGWWETSSPGLLTLLHKFRQSEACKPHDRVYALLGISSNAREDGRLQPDYDITYQDAIRRTLSYLISGEILHPGVYQLPPWDLDQVLGAPDDLLSRVLGWSLTHGSGPLSAKLLARQDIDVNSPVAKCGIPLHVLAKRGTQEMAVRAILERNTLDIDLLDSSGASALCLAAEHGRANMVKMLLEKGASIECRTSQGYTPLLCAARNSHKHVAEILLARGASVDATDSSNGRTSLWFAASRGDVGLLQLLREYGANLRPTDRTGQPALLVAVIDGHTAAVEFLLQHGLDSGSPTRTLLLQTLLGVAVENVHQNIIKLLLEQGANIGSADLNHNTPLAVALLHRHYDIAKLFLQEQARTHIGGLIGKIPLWLAVDSGREDLVEQMLAVGYDTNDTNPAGKTPLWLALNSRRDDIANLLLKKWPSPTSVESGIGHEGLWLAIDSGREDLVERMLAQGADANGNGLDRNKPIALAIARGEGNIVKLLLENGVDTNAKDSKGNSLLRLAILHGKEDVAKLLLEEGADANPSDFEGTALLRLAIHRDRRDLVELLLKQRAIANTRGSGRYTPLWLAVEYGRADMIRLLLEEVADANDRHVDGTTPLWAAISHSRADIVRVLLDEGADPNVKDSKDGTPLAHAFLHQKIEIAMLLLERGADVNATDSSDRAPLWTAVADDNKELVRLLLDKGADTNTRDIDGFTPLQYAFSHSTRIENYGTRIEIFRLLLEGGANPNVTDSGGRTPLWLAIAHDRADIFKVLLENGADANIRDLEGSTPLGNAARFGRLEIVRQLLEQGVDANARDASGRTPVGHAARYGRFEVVRQLLEHGVDANARDASDRTPLWLASQTGDKRTVSLLLAKGASM